MLSSTTEECLEFEAKYEQQEKVIIRRKTRRLKPGQIVQEARNDALEQMVQDLVVNNMKH